MTRPCHLTSPRALLFANQGMASIVLPIFLTVLCLTMGTWGFVSLRLLHDDITCDPPLPDSEIHKVTALAALWLAMVRARARCGSECVGGGGEGSGGEGAPIAR